MSKSATRPRSQRPVHTQKLPTFFQRTSRQLWTKSGPLPGRALTRRTGIRLSPAGDSLLFEVLMGDVTALVTVLARAHLSSALVDGLRSRSTISVAVSTENASAPARRICSKRKSRRNGATAGPAPVPAHASRGQATPLPGRRGRRRP